MALLFEMARILLLCLLPALAACLSSLLRSLPRGFVIGARSLLRERPLYGLGFGFGMSFEELRSCASVKEKRFIH